MAMYLFDNATMPFELPARSVIMKSSGDNQGRIYERRLNGLGTAFLV